MDLAAWTERGVDTVRMRRLGAGYALAAALLGGVVVAVAATSTGQGAEEDEPLDVVFGAVPEEEEPEPEKEQPEPEPEPEVAQTITPDAQPQQPYRPGPRVDPIETPTDVPDDAPAEKDPGGDFKPGGDDEYRNPGQGLPPPGPVQPPPPAPREEPKKKAAPKPKPKKPGRVTEGVTPPVAISQGAPSYPASARDQGIEGTVVVKYVVTDSGAVTDVKAVRGPPELRAVCVAAVQAWRFKPAVDENGKPIAVSRTAQFPFRIKTH